MLNVLLLLKQNELSLYIFLPEIVEQRLLFVLMVHLAEIIVYIYKINDFPYNVSMQHKHDESFVVQHTPHHHSKYDLQYQESEEQISSEKTKMKSAISELYLFLFLKKFSNILINLRHCIIYEGHLDYQTHPKII